MLAPALNLEQVRAALVAAGWDEQVGDDGLARALDALGWRLLEATQDHGAHYATPEEFERKNLQWSLTARGEAAIGGLLRALDAVRHAVPWRMGEGDYLAAVAAARDRVPLSRRLPPSPRDPRLQHAVAAAGVAVHEEEIRTDLLSAMVG